MLLALELHSAMLPCRIWAQAISPIGTVLVVEGMTEVQAIGRAEWEVLHFRDRLVPQDTVRTARQSRVKVLLRDDSILTLAEHSEMRFTEFLLAPQQRRTVVTLAVGTLRVITERLFGAGSITEVRTANTVVGVRGTTFVVRFIPPETTEVLSLSGVVSVRSLRPGSADLQPVPANFRTRVTGQLPPEKAVEISRESLQHLTQEMRLIEQIPSEVLPSEKMPPPTPSRDTRGGASEEPPVASAGIASPKVAPRAAPLLPLLAAPPSPAVLQRQPALERVMTPSARIVTPDTAMGAARMNRGNTPQGREKNTPSGSRDR